MIKKGLWAVGIIVVVFTMWVFLRESPKKIQSQTRFLMDTYCSIQVPGDIDVLKAIEKAFNRIEEIDVKFNALNPESPIYQFNNSNIPITDIEIVELVQKALDVSKMSDGNFDITVFSLIKLWGFFDDSPKVPGKDELEIALRAVSYENIFIENGELKKKGRLQKLI